MTLMAWEIEEWANDMITNGTGKIRQVYLAKFDAGTVAKKIWNDPGFTLGIEYGIKITVAKIFGELDDE